MHILKLEAENVKRLEAIAIEPNGNMVVIGGANGAGKSSALDCIEYALGGKKHICDMPLRNGAENGRIVLETDKYIVERTFTEKDSYIKVKTQEGYTIGTPQDLLNTLVGDLSFDPLEFTRLDSKKQAEVFMRLLKLDFSELDAESVRIEQERRDIGRDGKQIKARLDAMPEDPDAPKAEVAVADLMERLSNIQRHNQIIAQRRECLVDCETEVNAQKAAIERLEAELSNARDLLKTCEAEFQQARKEVEASGDYIEEASVREQISNADEVNTRYRNAVQRIALAEEYSSVKSAYEAKTARLQAISEEKARAISEAQFPVSGVTFSADGVLVNGVPFDQASSAEQLKIAVAMGLSANPQLKIVLIRDGSLLDENSLAAVADMAEKHDAQVWMERVGTGKEVSVVIADGRVLEDRTQKVTEVAA